MPSLKDLVTSFSSLQEFGRLAQAILPIMKDADVSRDEKRKILNDLVNELSDRTFGNPLVVKQIMIIINMKEEVCKEYANTDSQVNGILSWLPRMAKHREVLKEEVAKHRKQYGLQI